MSGEVVQFLRKQAGGERGAAASAGTIGHLLDPPTVPVGARPRSLLDEARGNPEAVLAEIDRLHVPPTVEQVHSWLLPVAAGVRKEPSRDLFDGRVLAIVLASDDLPAWVFNRSAQRAGMAKWTRFPSVAEVRQVVQASARSTFFAIGQLRATVEDRARQRALPLMALPQARTAAEHEHVRQTVAAFAAEMRGRDQPGGAA